jgi:hypothetical protein
MYVKQYLYQFLIMIKLYLQFNFQNIILQHLFQI